MEAEKLEGKVKVLNVSDWAKLASATCSFSEKDMNLYNDTINNSIEQSPLLEANSSQLVEECPAFNGT
jgi:hypothetical protein